MRYCQIQRNFRDSEYLCKLGKEYLNKFYTFFWTKFANFWHIIRPSTTNYRKVINIQKWSSFLAHPVCRKTALSGLVNTMSWKVMTYVHIIKTVGIIPRMTVVRVHIYNNRVNELWKSNWSIYEIISCTCYI